MRILCTADIHVGRTSRCDGEIAGESSALAAWERIVQKAIEGKAQAVLIAGDLYDSLPAQYETRTRVRRAFERLRDAGIPAVAVAGNHDYDALPDFRQAFDGLVHVFAEDRWDQFKIDGVRFVGRSFGAQFADQSLLSNFDLPQDGPTIGLIHADVNAQTRYGPTPLEQFAGRGVAAWVVGHVHVPRLYNGGPPVAYPGSPQALDWGETGTHGFRWLTIKDGTPAFSDVQPISTVRYEYVNVDLGPGESLEMKLSEKAAALREAHQGIESVRFRVYLRLKPGAHLPPGPETMVDGDGYAYAVRSAVAVPEIDLLAEANQRDARGQAARLLLGLQGRDEWREQVSKLVEQVSRQMEVERKNLRLREDEALDSLRQAAPEEAENAVRQVLERVLSVPSEGTR